MMKTISSNSPDLILRSPAERSEAGRLEGWQLARSSVAILRDASLTRCSSSFETHRSRDAPHPSRRIARAMLLRMRFRVDDEKDWFKFPGPHPEAPGRAQESRASRRMAACTVVRGHPSRRIAHAMLLRMRFRVDTGNVGDTVLVSTGSAPSLVYRRERRH